ncbi:hypothetical protein N7540_011828 [Penicillium herquei]|nr:hypothetical protein N7540_011828 [Penicillium herquei]
MSPYLQRGATGQRPLPYIGPYVSWARQHNYFTHSYLKIVLTRRDSGGCQHLTAKNSSRSSVPLRIPGQQALDNSSFNEA